MKTLTITLGEVNGASQTLPDRKIIKDAQRNMCMSAAFWAQIKAGKIPYIFSKEKKELTEATYTETVAYLNKSKGTTPRLEHMLAGTPASEKPEVKPLTHKADQLYWLTDEEYPAVNKTLQNIDNISVMKQSYLEQIEKFK
jgi:hypothetical protein